jgi:hypothetical protein
MQSQDHQAYKNHIAELEKLLEDQKRRFSACQSEILKFERDSQSAYQAAESEHAQEMKQLRATFSEKRSQLETAIDEKQAEIQRSELEFAQEQKNLQEAAAKTETDLQSKLSSERARQRVIELNRLEILECQEYFKLQVDAAGLEEHSRKNEDTPSVYFRRVEQQLARVLRGESDSAFALEANRLLRVRHPHVRKCWANMVAEIDSKILDLTAVKQKGFSMQTVVIGLLKSLKRDRCYTVQIQGGEIRKAQDYIWVDASPQGSLIYKLGCSMHNNKSLDQQELDTVFGITVC